MDKMTITPVQIGNDTFWDITVTKPPVENHIRLTGAEMVELKKRLAIIAR